MRFKLVFLLSFLVVAFAELAQAVPNSNGVYVVFQTTKGTFYARLRNALVPRTSANFVALVEGTKDWLDYPNAAVVKRPFYNGTTFHRVIPGFMIQGGSPNGMGTDDPGYQFKDEFNSTLKHDKAGILSMANSGPDSNGSQFFITVTNTPHLDNVHTVFGEVVEGMNVVYQIAAVPTDANDKPLTPVVITNVTTLRIGPGAIAFNANAPTPLLPTPAPIVSRISWEQSGLACMWTSKTNHEYRMCATSDFTTWEGIYVGPFIGRYVNDFKAAHTNHYFTTFETKID